MSRNSGIDYVDASWGPWRGCTPVSEGCENCYARNEMKRFGHNPHKIVRASDATFYAPLKWKEPKRVFVCPWGDFFHPDVPHEWQADAWEVMGDEVGIKHTYLIVTKRPEFIEKRVPEDGCDGIIFIVTAENQKHADERIPIILDLKARGIIQNVGISIEPMLEPMDVSEYIFGYGENYQYECDVHEHGYPANCRHKPDCEGCAPVPTEWVGGPDWVILGAESGPNRRYCDPQHMIDVVKQCDDAGVPVFVKQVHISKFRSRDGDFDEIIFSKNPSEWPHELRRQEIPAERGKERR